MSPGPLSSAHRGGLSFLHGGGRHVHNAFGRQFGTPTRNRRFDARPPGKFYVDDDGRGVLEPGDKITFEVDEDGAVTVGVENNGTNGDGEKALRRGLFGLRRMTTTNNPDGSLTVEAEPNAVLMVEGGSGDQSIVVVEVFETDDANGTNGA